MSSTFEQSTFAATMMDSEAGDADVGSYGYLARYRLDRMIGHGAMGAVFEAYDDTLGRTIAIKTLYTQVTDEAQGGFDSATIDAAILQEARTAATLNHPNIVTVFDAGRGHSTMLNRELPYVAMELLQGRDLRERVSQAPALSQREAVSLVGKVAIALDHAHKAGVLHRDIKPANIFITKTGAPKILDFGLAKFTARAAKTANLTTSDVVAGSPQYMSPELVRSIGNSSLRVDERSDVYSLGVILYELLCGKKPFVADTLDLLQQAILQSVPDAPHVVNAAVPRELSTIVMNTLAKKPEERYRSAGQLSRELRRWGANTTEFDPEATIIKGAPASDKAALMPDSLAGGLTSSDDLATRPPASESPVDMNEPAVFSNNTSSPRRGLPLMAIGAAALVGLAAVLWLVVGKPNANPASPALAKQSTPAAKAVPAPAAPAPAVVAASAAAAPVAVAAASAVAPVVAAAGVSPPTASAPVATSPTLASLSPGETLVGSSTAPTANPASTKEPLAPLPSPSPSPATPSANAAAVTPAATSPFATLTPDAPTTGRVRINVLPWGNVEVDGKKMGVSPPLTQLTLEPGDHTIVLTNSDYKARTLRVKVEAGKTQRINHNFE